MTRIIDRIDQSGRAVSPVIGVILMVAITVILAAVIGAFVLEIGDQQETAPSTSFDSEQYTEFIEAPNGKTGNYTVVALSHAGGDVVDVQNVVLKYKGNTSLWSYEGNDEIAPQPDMRPALGTNEKVQFTSGESWTPFAYGGWTHEEAGNCNFEMNRIVTGQNYPAPRIYATGNACDLERENWAGSMVNWANANPILTRDGVGFGSPGEDLNVVWTADSGGKTQTLFKYTIQ